MTYFVVVGYDGDLRIYNRHGFLGTWRSLAEAFNPVSPDIVIIIGPSGPCV